MPELLSELLSEIFHELLVALLGFGIATLITYIYLGNSTMFFDLKYFQYNSVLSNKHRENDFVPDKKIIFIIIFSFVCYITTATIYSLYNRNIVGENNIPKPIIATQRTITDNTNQYIPKTNPQPQNPTSKQENNQPTKEIPTDAKTYISSIQKEIKKNWIIPKEVKMQIENSTTVQIFFSINRQGEFSNIKITKTSGNAALDKTMTDAIKTSSGKIPLPAKLPDKTDIQFSFSYNVIK